MLNLHVEGSKHKEIESMHLAMSLLLHYCGEPYHEQPKMLKK